MVARDLKACAAALVIGPALVLGCGEDSEPATKSYRSPDEVVAAGEDELGTDDSSPAADGTMSACSQAPTLRSIARSLRPGSAVVTVTAVELSPAPETREVPVEDGTWTETIYEATLRGVSVVSESAPPGPWVVRNPQASVHVLADGRVFRVQPEEPDPYDPFTVLRRGDTGPFLLTATMFGGRPRVSRALPIEGTDVVLADGRMPLDEVTRLVGRAP